MEHPIAPPPELVQQWDSEAATADMPDQVYIATQAARWGADQELEACCEWLGDDDDRATLRAARRPKPPSLKQQALEALDALPTPTGHVTTGRIDTIRRALESLPDTVV